MAKTDPRLAALLSKRKSRLKSAAEPAKDTPEQAPEPEFIGALVKCTGSPDFLKDFGCQIGAVAGSIVSVRIPIDRIEEVSAHPDVVRIEFSRRFHPELDESIKEIHADTLRNSGYPFAGAGKFTGQGVIVGVIDAGFNFAHKVFRDPANPGQSRIYRLYDMSFATPGALPAPAPDGEGVGPVLNGNRLPGRSFKKAELEAVLGNADPLALIPDINDSHGTHVAGIAAGNGAQAGGEAGASCSCHGAYTYVGVAPEAELILVKLVSGSNQLGESSNLVDAIGYIRDRATAAGKPAVINISLGDNLGAHDGTSLVEEAIDGFLTGATGFTIVKSAGNQGAAKKHAQATVPAGGTLEISMRVWTPGDGDDRNVEIDIWYPDANEFDCTVNPPAGNATTGTQTASVDNLANFTVDTPGNKSDVSIDSTSSGLGGFSNSKNRIFITLDPKASNTNAVGTWKIVLKNTSGPDAPFHAWIERDQSAKFTTHETNACTISTPGTSKEVITVGNYDGKGKDKGPIVDSSSRGPTSDGFTKPDLAAPGHQIISAKHDAEGGACCDCCYSYYTPKTGTSMSTPHVVGAIALMLEKSAALTHTNIKDTIRASARLDSDTGNMANFNYGYGKLDVAAALNDMPVPAAPHNVARPPLVERVVAPPPPEPLATDADTPLLRFLATERGRELYDLVQRHHDEVRMLINSNKRVATVWHRNDGPLLGHYVIRCSMLPHVTMPVEVNGRSVTARIDAIAGILSRYGNPELQKALELALPLARQLPGKNLNEAIAYFQELNEAVHA